MDKEAQGKIVNFIESSLVTTIEPDGTRMHHIDDAEWQSVKTRALKIGYRKPLDRPELKKDNKYRQAVKDSMAGKPLDLTEEEFGIFCSIENMYIDKISKTKDAECQGKAEISFKAGCQEGWNRAKEELETNPEILRIAREELEDAKKAGIKEAVDKLKRWRSSGTHLISNEALEELEGVNEPTS